MNYTLRPYQVKGINDIREKYKEGYKSICYVAPTGSGKSILFSYMSERALQKKKTVMILVHRNVLLKQTSEKLKEIGIRHGIISANYPEIRYSVQVASVQTLIRRLNRWPHIDLLIIDECHHAPSNTWKKILNHFRDAHVLGVTASPCRLDNKGLGNFFDTMVIGPTVKDLVGGNYLSQPIVYAAKEIDLKGVHKTAGDYNRKELSTRMNNHVTGCAVSHYKKTCPHEPAVAFCVSIEHAEKVAYQFRQSGFKSKAIHSKMDAKTINKYILMLAKKQIHVLTSCDMISEGFDVPVIRASILLRPTQSMQLFLQQIGRALRPYPGKPNAIILDHAGNCQRFGMLPTTEIKWKLTKDKIKIEQKVKKIHRCPVCWIMFEGIICPECGHRLQKKKDRSREPEQRDGELKIINKEELKQRIEKANTRKELYKIAKQAGYKPGWAYYEYKRKIAKRLEKNI